MSGMFQATVEHVVRGKNPTPEMIAIEKVVALGDWKTFCRDRGVEPLDHPDIMLDTSLLGESTIVVTGWVNVEDMSLLSASVFDSRFVGDMIYTARRRWVS